MFNNLTPVVKNLVIINVLVYASLWLLKLPDDISVYFMLFKSDAIIPRPLGSASFFRPAQVVTYFFNHGGIFHILFNMLALTSIGSIIERVFGPEKFLKFYLFCGIFGGILVTLFDPSESPVVGASGAILGVLVAFAVHFPQEKLMVFPFPPVASRILVVIVGALSAGLVLAQVAGYNVGGGISHFGHLAGIASALVYFVAEKYIPFLRK